MQKRSFSMLVILVFLVCLFVFVGCSSQVEEGRSQNEVARDTSASMDNAPMINGIEDITVDEFTDFDPLAGVTAVAGERDLTSAITVLGEVNTEKAGLYELIYSLKDSDYSVSRVVTVQALEAVPANGTYNYKFSSADLRHTFMAAAEDYLLHNQYSGIPLFSDSGFVIYSNRLQLVSENYLPVLGFGIWKSTMSVDDSQVLMEDGQPGQRGEYTFRTTISNNPSSWNQWTYDDDVSSTILGNVLGSLYGYDFNDDKTGYVLLPSMAADDPQPVNGNVLPSGKVVANTWRVSIKDGLTWAFNEATDTSKITDTVIDATDFYNTYKIALNNKWFRAISGGGDFCTGNGKVVNAQEFVDGIAEWEDVGIKLIDDHTLEFTFVDAQSEWNVKYFLTGVSLTPIQTELYEALGENYGIDEKSIAYSGAYYVDYYESDKIIRTKKNTLYPESDQSFYTGYTFNIINDSEMIFQEFLAGKLDNTGLPNNHYEAYKSYPGLKRIPGASTIRLVINGLGTVENQIEQFPDSKWTPEPILANQDFKMAMYHVIDRKKLAEDVMKISQIQMYHFTDAYLVEAEGGIPYRNTPQGQAVGGDLSPSTYGYNYDAARAYFEKAIDELVANGTYSSGDEIVFEFYYFTGDEALVLLGSYIKDTFEEAFISEKHNISVKVEPIAKDFPSIYYDHMMVGEFDTSIGIIVGSQLDAASALTFYNSDNRSGFTLNWGIDTSLPEITVAYENDQGEFVKELWSFDAITSVLSGEVVVVNGAEVKKKSRFKIERRVEATSALLFCFECEMIR